MQTTTSPLSHADYVIAPDKAHSLRWLRQTNTATDTAARMARLQSKAVGVSNKTNGQTVGSLTGQTARGRGLVWVGSFPR